MKGAKPKHDAIRRGITDAYGLAAKTDAAGVLMPEDIALDPESPAVAAKEMLDDIMNFYCKDYYNP